MKVASCTEFPCGFVDSFVNTVITAKSVSELLISKYRASYQLEMARNPGKFG